MTLLLECRILAASLGLALLLPASPASAHPIEYHYGPLEAATVERVLDCLDRMVVELERNGALSSARLPEGALGIAALGPTVEDAILVLNETGDGAAATLNELLAACGYRDSLAAMSLWQAEAERVLETYEVLVRNLDWRTVNEAFRRYDSERARLTEAQTLDREMRLFRDEQLLKTAGADTLVLEPFRQRVDLLTRRLGASP